MDGLFNKAEKFLQSDDFRNKAESYLESDQAKKIEQQIKDKTGFDVSQYLPHGQQAAAGGAAAAEHTSQETPAAAAAAAPSKDAFGNEGQPGQYGQAGQYGAVTGSGFGGSLAKGPDGEPLQKPQGQTSAYEGFTQDDSTATGGYGRNAQGGAFSRANQLGTDNVQGAGSNNDDPYDAPGYKTGTSTPGYRQDGELAPLASTPAVRTQNKDDEPEI